MSFQIDHRNRALDALVSRAIQKGLDEEQASYLCKLGSVLICGHLERCIEIIITNRLSKSPPQITNFLKKFFKRGTNYDCDKIAQLLYQFDPEWGRKFEDFLDDSDKTSVSSCYAVRNSVAHGGGQSVGPKTLEQYYKASLSVIEKLKTSLK